MDNQKPTPRPWDLIDNTYFDKLIPLGEHDDDNYNILQIEHGERISPDERIANVKFIDKAVNSFDDMIKTIERLKSYIQHGEGDEPTGLRHISAMELCDSTIAKAKDIPK